MTHQCPQQGGDRFVSLGGAGGERDLLLSFFIHTRLFLGQLPSLGHLVLEQTHLSVARLRGELLKLETQKCTNRVRLSRPGRTLLRRHAKEIWA